MKDMGFIFGDISMLSVPRASPSEGLLVLHVSADGPRIVYIPRDSPAGVTEYYSGAHIDLDSVTRSDSQSNGTWAI